MAEVIESIVLDSGIRRRNDAGGAAAQAGDNYQDRVAAWYCVRMLAGSAAEPGLGLPRHVRFTAVRCQAESPVDDVVVTTNDEGFLFIEAKNRVPSVSVKQGFRFAEILDQFVRQLLAMGQPGELGDWRRPLDPEKDRLILATGSSSTRSLTQTLRLLLQRFRDLPDVCNLTEAARNAKERSLAAKLEQCASYSWRRSVGTTPGHGELAAIFKTMRVLQLDLAEDAMDLRNALDTLRSQLLRDPDQDGVAWSVLVELAAQRHEHRSGFTVGSLAEELRRTGIALRSPPDFRGPIEALRKTSREHLRDARRFSELIPGKSSTAIERDVTAELLRAVEAGSLLVVGEPGAGKSGLLYTLANSLEQGGASVVFLSVQDITSATDADLNRALGLEEPHELTEVLSNWFESERGYTEDHAA